MANSKNKKSSPVLLFAAGFVLIFILMFIANSKKSKMTDLPSPAGGVENVYTLDNQLVVISNSDEIYLWDWNRLKDDPKIKNINAEKVLLSHSDNLVMVPPERTSSVVIENFHTSANKRELKLNNGWKYLQMAQSRDGKYVTIAQSNALTGEGKFRFERLSEEFDSLENIMTLEEKGLSIFAIAVSDDGRLIVTTGGKNKEGWIIVIDVNKRERLWSKKIPNSSYLTDAIFDMNSKNIFVGGEGRYLFQIEAATGVIIRQFKTKIKISESFNEPRVTAVKISPDGSTIAACVNPDNTVQFWDILSGKSIGIKRGSRGLNNLAFSPDSSMFLTAGRVHGGPFKVMSVPE